MAAAAPGPVVRASGETFSKVVLLRPLRRAGALPWSSWAAHGTQDQGLELLAADRFPKALAHLLEIEEDGRVLIDWPHPNLAMVRDVIVDADALLVLSDFIEAERLDELRRPTGKEQMPLEVGLRVVVDVLAALSALHGVRKGMVHGQVLASNILVGHDGVARLARGYLGRGGVEIVDPSALGYLAPEILRGDESIDSRADIYSAGVLLWETLTQRRLHAGATKATLLANFTKPRAKATPPTSATWAAALVDVADKALSADPAGRYATSAEMAAAVRLIVRARLAMPQKVASWVDTVAGVRIIGRRSELGVPAEMSVRHSRPSLPTEAMKALDAMKAPSKPPRAIIPQAPPEPRISNIDELDAADIMDAPPSSPMQPVAAQKKEPPPPPAFVAAALSSLESTPVKEHAKESTPAEEPAAVIVTPAPIPAPVVDLPETDERAATTERRPRKNRKGIVVVVLGLAVIVIAVAGIKIAVHELGGPAIAPSATVAITSSTAPAIPTPAPTPTPTSDPTVSSPAASDSAEPAPTDTATAPPSSTFHPHPKPKSTYDPQGI